MSAKSPNITATFDAIRNDYEAAHDSRLRRRRTGILWTGSHADWHLRNGFDHLKIMEQARAMDRDDVIIGQLVDRAVLNTIQNGFAVDPKTGDKELDLKLWELFTDWGEDASRCDASGEMTFAQMEEIVFRSRLVDGDIFAIPLESGQLQLIEGHRCRTPIRTEQNVVLGVKMDPDTRERIEYWFTREDIDPTAPGPKLVGDVDKYPAFDEDGNPGVFHVYDAKRPTQTRGISAFAPVVGTAAMVDDILLAKLVQQQVVSCVTFLRNRGADFEGGKPEVLGGEEEFFLGTATKIAEQLAPGLELASQPGETITGFSPQVPNETFFPHIRLMLQMIGVNLGMPLVMVLMDASDTNFSGWRGAVDQAQRGFRRNQLVQARLFNSQVYRWRLRVELQNDPALRAKLEEIGPVRFFRHKWNTPRWPYIQPLQDAQADALRLRERLTSPRRLHAERGQDWDEIYAECIEDNGAAIEAAILRAQGIEERTSVKVDWREMLYITPPVPASVILDTSDKQGGNNGQ